MFSVAKISKKEQESKINIMFPYKVTIFTKDVNYTKTKTFA